jgi:UDP-N-acetylglucosamine 2-epimerase
MSKTIVTITGIRPDFIRMSEIFKKLDRHFNHILIHTGQHYDKLLSDVFFKDLKIREPDFNLGVGGPGKEHFHVTADLSVKIIELLRNQAIKPDLIMFLGDSNSVCSAVALKKEGYRIAHIEAGMRSGDKRMLEEINRTVCDHCSDFHFVYHKNYRNNLLNEGLDNKNIHVVGNTIVEVVNPIINKFKPCPKIEHIILDVHRPENFKYEERLRKIVQLANEAGTQFRLPVKMLKFPRTQQMFENFKIDLGKIEIIDLMPYVDYLDALWHSRVLISDSGTAQEEPAFLRVPVLVPRDFTERPESVANGCSIMVDLKKQSFCSDLEWAWIADPPKTTWLGDGTTSEQIIEVLKHI